MDSGIENMEVEDSDRREKRNLTDKVNGREHYSNERAFSLVSLCLLESKLVFKRVNIKPDFGYLQECNWGLSIGILSCVFIYFSLLI